MKNVVQELLKQYLKVEMQFQQGSYDKCCGALKDKNKDDMLAVTAAIFSHRQVSNKNNLIIAIIVSVLIS
jgi:hypothetical protein